MRYLVRMQNIAGYQDYAEIQADNLADANTKAQQRIDDQWTVGEVLPLEEETKAQAQFRLLRV